MRRHSALFLFGTCILKTLFIFSVENRNFKLVNAFSASSARLPYSSLIHPAGHKREPAFIRAHGSPRKPCIRIPAHTIPLYLSSNNDNDGDGTGTASPGSIPAELYDTIAAAEAATPAAAGRNVRIAGYIGGAVLCLVVTALCAATSATEGSTEPPIEWLVAASRIPLVSAGFVGTAVYTLLTGALGTLVLLEFQGAERNRLAIWEEILRRRTEETQQTKKKKKKRAPRGGGKGKSDKGMGKNRKRKKAIDALSEVMVEDTAVPAVLPSVQTEEKVTSFTSEKQREDTNNPLSSISNKVKDVYRDADSQGYAQALFLNKKLEEMGLLEPIIAQPEVDEEEDDEDEELGK